MKLLYCRKCGDVFNLSLEEEKVCSCGRTKGRYLDNLNAEYFGVYAVPLGINNNSLTFGILQRPIDGKGKELKAFVIPWNCDTFKRRLNENC